jgi:hypothetical protein
MTRRYRKSSTKDSDDLPHILSKLSAEDLYAVRLDYLIFGNAVIRDMGDRYVHVPRMTVRFDDDGNAEEDE